MKKNALFIALVLLFLGCVKSREQFEVDMLEQNHSDDSLRQELVMIKEEKSRYESTAKDSLRRMLEEKIEATGKASEVEVLIKICIFCHKMGKKCICFFVPGIFICYWFHIY